MADQSHARETWREMVERLRADGAVDAGQETTLYRFFSDKEVVQTQALERISAEYTERVSTDGQQSADDWLKSAAEQMGRSDREDTDRMLSSIGVELPPAT